MSSQAGQAGTAATKPFAGPLAAAWGKHASAESLVELLAQAHGRIPVPTSGDRTFWDAADRPTISALVRRATADLGQPWPQPLTAQYARFFRDGNRTEYENLVGERQRRLSRAAIAAAATSDPVAQERFLDEVVDGVILLCEQSSWSWAAHDDTFSRFGSITPTVTSPYLDLGAGEVLAQLGWTDHLLGELLDRRAPGVRTRIRVEAEARCFEPFMTRHDWHWLGLDGNVHNWNPWVHGNLLVGALTLVDDPRRRAGVTAAVIEGLDRFVSSLPHDGAIDEGYSYWWNGAGRLLEALDLLAQASNGTLDAAAIPAVRETVRFPNAMHVGGDWYLNIADGQARPPRDQAWHVPYRWARRTGNETAMRHAASYRAVGRPAVDEDGGLGRALVGLSDHDWIDAEPGEPPLVRDIWLGSVQVALAREVSGTSCGLTLAVKGGHNGENHNHNDVGTVFVALDGVPVVVDAGKPTYTAQTFGPDRYSIWTMQSSWHNVPEPRGTAQSTGREYGARNVAYEANDTSMSMRMDLSAAYDLPELKRWERRAELDRTRGAVTVDDDWELSDTGDVSVHYLLHGQVRLDRPGRVVVNTDAAGRSLLISWDPGGATGSLEDKPLDDPLLRAVWGSRLTRLRLLAIGSGERGHLSVTMATVDIDTVNFETQR